MSSNQDVILHSGNVVLKILGPTNKLYSVLGNRVSGHFPTFPHTSPTFNNLKINKTNT